MKNCIKLNLTKFQRQVIVGTLLGDAHAEPQNKGVSFRLKFEQGYRRKEYLYHLYDIFSFCSRSLPSKRVRRIALKDRTFTSTTWFFSTLSFPEFTFYGKYFYTIERKKRIPKNIGRFITPIVLAYWYMDGGSMKSKESKGVILKTQGFQFKEVELLVCALEQKFNLKAKSRKQKEGYQIYISGDSYDSFFSIVQPYIHSSMIYKLPVKRKTRILT